MTAEELCKRAYDAWNASAALTGVPAVVGIGVVYSPDGFRAMPIYSLPANATPPVPTVAEVVKVFAQGRIDLAKLAVRANKDAAAALDVVVADLKAALP